MSLRSICIQGSKDDLELLILLPPATKCGITCLYHPIHKSFSIGGHSVAHSGLIYSEVQVGHFLALASSVVGFQVCVIILGMGKPFERMSVSNRQWEKQQQYM